MRLTLGFLKPATLPRLDEGQPLPPDDRVIARDRALGELYLAHAPRLLNYFSRRADRQDAGDLVHESFVRFADTALARTDIDCPEAYLNRIASNLLRDRARTALQRSLARHVPADDASLPGCDPVARLEARDSLARLDLALRRLKPKTRAIFLAHRRDGLSYREIADQTGLGLKGVEWHMAKAIDQLDRALRR